MKPFSILMRATAITAFAGAVSALAGAALAQEVNSQEADEVMTVEGHANAPASNSFIQDNDLLRAVAEAWDNSDLDRAPYTDDHHWIGLRVQSADGGRIGEIERVRLSAEGDVEAIVVESGGWMDIGGREVLIEQHDVSFSPHRRRPVAVIAYTRAEFEALPRFNEDAASEFPLSDRDYGDNENDLELDDGPASAGS
ncbi:PRC-barrel domain-containing protein [Maricaulis sp.]|uniref:PRC-barrel domain-containing protein n=1 Tax=Maricaulis sp. TaxID=1486257 RepID=UPI00260B4B1A|nr:PRC-barrel domain-containing protein [Maricaulis sp.]